ncbi:hypothetical protein K1719_033150 [Acacia pycnantha]|nr:hypothetical protein K1719_033150 [Acacia pycnantha]
MDSDSPLWSDLRSDLLLNIANLLDSGIDRLCLRAVCHSWRSLLPPPSRRPPLRLPFPMGPSPQLNPERRGYFNLVVYTVYCLQPLKRISDTWKTPKCWLIMIDETEEPGKVRLTDPLSPSHHMSTCLPTTLNLFDFRVSEITKAYDLQFVGNCEMPELDFPEFSSIHARRVAVCSSEGAAFAVMAVDADGELSIWRTGDEKWIGISDAPDDAPYNDVVYHNGKFYAVDERSLTISVDLSLTIGIVTPAKPPVDCGPFDGPKRLLSFLGGLFLLEWDFDFAEMFLSGKNLLGTYFHVYKLNEGSRKWVPVKNLGNRAIFIRAHCSFSVSAQEFRGCQKNCIYFNGGCLLPGEDYPGRGAAVYDMEDCSAKFLSKVFSYSGLFWPPPSWVMTRDAMS